MGDARGPQEAPLPPQPHKKPSMDELFEHRWRKAYELRAVEAESRQQPAAKGPAAEGETAIAIGGGGKEAPAAAVPVHVAAGAAAAAAQGQTVSSDAGDSEPQLRQAEVVSDDEDEAAAAPSTAAAAANGAGAPQLQPEGLQEQAEEDEEAEPECRLVWDGSSRRPAAAAEAPDAAVTAAAAISPEALALKEEGNARFRAANYEAAVCCYSQALEAAASAAAAADGPGSIGADPGSQPAADDATAAAAAAADSAAAHFRATLLSNRAHALLRLQRASAAADDALQASNLRPGWLKPLHRLAQARLALRQWAGAVAACRQGEALAARDSEGHTEFTPLLDRIAVAAAHAGSLAGFDGQQLEVRSAGDEAWLGGPAPHVLALDGPEDEDASGPATTLALPSSPGGGASSDAPAAGSSALAAAGAAGSADALVSWDFRRTAAAAAARRTSFRSIAEAVSAARDGDRILLRCGVHNGMGESVTLSKRLLIEGEGALGEAIIDQRTNVPMFRITRSGAVLRNIDLDQTGFREALLVDAPAPPIRPLLAGCRLRCSGDDAVNTGGAAAPTFLRCTIQAKRVGLKAYGSSAPRLEACTIEQCGEQGVRAQEAAAPGLHRCSVSGCAEEAVAAMGTARLTLAACSLRDCKGPGVDLSGSAEATISGGSIEACVGGVWLWEAARATLRGGATVAGGPSHAILADGDAALEIRDSIVRGSVHATDAAWSGILHASNRLADPEGPTDFPPEEGPFRFVPDRWRAKQ